MTRNQLKQIIREEYRKISFRKSILQRAGKNKPQSEVAKLKKIINEEMKMLGIIGTPALGNLYGSRTRRLYEADKDDKLEMDDKDDYGDIESSEDDVNSKQAFYKEQEKLINDFIEDAGLEGEEKEKVLATLTVMKMALNLK